MGLIGVADVLGWMIGEDVLWQSRPGCEDLATRFSGMGPSRPVPSCRHFTPK